MTIRIATMAGLALFGACGSVPVTGNEAQAAVAAARTFDIAGVRPGMKAAEAVAILERGGWAIETHKGDSWNEAVERAVDRRLDRMTGMYTPQTGVEGYRGTKSEESVSVSITPSPDGGRVGQISYHAPQAGRSDQQIRADVIRRYGAPTSSPRQRLRIAPQGDAGQALTLDLGSTGMMLMLVPGSIADRAAQATLDRAVDAKVGKVGTSF